MSEIKIPSWLSEKENFSISNKARGAFLENSVKSILSLLSKFEEEPYPSFASAIDIRVKTFLIAFSIIIVLFSKSFPQLIASMIFSLFVYIFAGKALFKVFPLILFSVAFFMLISLPASTNLAVDGEILYPLFHTKGDLLGIKIPSTVAVTKEGTLSIFRLFLRSFSSLLLTLFLFSTTAPNRFIKDVPMPPSFKILFTITFFNIKKLLTKLNEILLAGISRSPISANFRRSKNFSALSTAKVFQESLKISEEMHLSMKSRCWNNKISSSSSLFFKLREAASVLVATIFFLIVLSL
ncbi:MAG: hypothetical protein N2445_05090 [Acidobacteria bacterium]|nr:hypothetical protein [Acidobacteriota bacterium]